MPELYDNETLRYISENVNLVQYASRTMDLIKKGDDYFAHCPKHIDKTASLSFSPDKNLYHCFSCGRSGNIINFIMDFEDATFEKSVEKAIKLSEIDISKICHSKTVAFLRNFQESLRHKELIRHNILDLNELKKYKKEPIIEWEEEGIKQNVMDLFGVRVDAYGNRIVYPVYDIDGNLINIKGRTRYSNYKALKIPKYINYYPVGTMDYLQGLNITFPYIKEKNEIIIFESIKSVMLAYGWNFKNCASAEKHTLTDEQVKLLTKLKINIVFAYDSDVDYKGKDVAKSINKLKRLTNVYVIKDKQLLLGGKKARNSPVDCGIEIWKKLYSEKLKVV